MMISAPDVEKTYSLLEIIADPEKAKATLDALDKARKDIETATFGYQRVLDDAKAAKEASAVALAEANETLAKVSAANERKDKTLSAKDAELKQKSQDLENAFAILQSQQATYDAQKAEQDVALEKREKHASAREAAVTEAEANVEALRKEYETKLAALKAAMGG